MKPDFNPPKIRFFEVSYFLPDTVVSGVLMASNEREVLRLANKHGELLRPGIQEILINEIKISVDTTEPMLYIE